MSNSICKFLPAKHRNADVKAVRFIYETEIASLQQPFIYPVYLVAIVTRGNARLSVCDREEIPIERGSVFFAFPALHFELRSFSFDFEYIYISFMGSGVPELLSRFEVEPDNCVFKTPLELCEIYESSVRRINLKNANVLAEGVLLYTLSFISGDEGENVLKKSHETVFSAIVDYLEKHYREPGISLKRIASIFSYTDKYLSALFKRNMHIGFNTYLNNLRIAYANELIASGISSVADIASAAGFRDPLYFSKIYRKKTGKTPTESISKNSLLSKYINLQNE